LFVQKFGKVMKWVWNKKRTILQIALAFAFIGTLWIFSGLGYSYVNQFYQNSSSKFSHNLDKLPKSCSVHRTSDILKGFCLHNFVTTETISGSVNHAQTNMNVLSQAMSDVLSTNQMGLGEYSPESLTGLSINFNGKQQPVILSSNENIFQKEQMEPRVATTTILGLCIVLVASIVFKCFKNAYSDAVFMWLYVDAVLLLKPSIPPLKLQTERIYNITMIVEILIIFVQDSIEYIINGVQLLLLQLHCIQYIINKMRSAVFSGVIKRSLNSWVKMKTCVKGKQIQENKKSKRNIIQQKNRKQHIKRSTWKQY